MWVHVQRTVRVSSRDREAFPEELACELRLDWMRLEWEWRRGGGE